MGSNAPTTGTSNADAAGSFRIEVEHDMTRYQIGREFQRTNQDYRYGYWGWWFFNRVEFRDEQVVFFADYLPSGTYQYTYYL